MESRTILGITGGVLMAATALTVLLGSWYTVDQGYRGVILRNGALVGIAEPGLGFKVPMIDSVRDISVQDKVRVLGDQVSIASYSKDQQPADIRVSVNYRIPADKVGDVYAQYGGEEGLILRALDPRVYPAVKNIFGGYNAVTAIQERARLNREMFEALQASMSGEPIILTGFQIENIDFSSAYEESIEQRMQAEVEVQKLRQNAEREKVQAEITVTKAKAEADSITATAKAQADAIRLKGDAEAGAIEARGRALANNPNVIDLVQAEKWNGALPLTMVPNSALPFVNVK